MASLSSETRSVLSDLSNNLADAVERAGASTVAVHARQRQSASGVLWRPGVIVATDHTIERDDDITVTLPDGKSVSATLAGRDPSTDIAILKVESANLPVAAVGDASALRVGHMALAVGRFGEGGLGTSLGVVSALGGSWNTWRGGQVDQFIRADVTLYPGFSGGPLVNAAGEIVGINTSGLSRNMGLTIPAATVNRVVDQLLSKGHIARGYLGVGLQPVRLPDTLKQAVGAASDTGVIIISIEGGGPAEKAGLFIGDILIALDGTPTTDTDAVQALLGPERIGAALAAKIARGGAPVDVTITVGERPQRES
ncbi:MAG: S1C family serine protease [Chloroflexota bacterium]|nr:S1C family serine protease [Chloroflexota bacterium]